MVTKRRAQTWAIGDIHGCFATLMALLETLTDRHAVDLERDHLWLVGDLVHRGPRSLDVLRWAYATERRMGDRLVSVMGNHDLHLLAAAHGRRKIKAQQRNILKAKDADRLLDWLRHRPVLHQLRHRDDDDDWMMVHAGLWPRWSDQQALDAARRVEKKMRGNRWLKLLEPFEEPADDDSVRAALYAFTGLRLLRDDGRPSTFKGPPGEAPAGERPWFVARSLDRVSIVFGHWAALGRHLDTYACCLDSGAAWSRPLSAMRLDDRTVVEQPNLDH